MPDGAYLQSSNGSLQLNGQFVYDWIERLVPLLDGRHLLDDLTAGASEPQRAMVENLIGVLAQHGMVTDQNRELPHGLTDGELAAYAEEIAFLDAAGGSGAHRFERFRRQPVLLAGAGPVLTAMVHAALQLGICRVGVTGIEETGATGIGETGADRDRRQEILAWLRERDDRLELHPGPELDDLPIPQLRMAIGEYAAVLYCCDPPEISRALRLSRAAAGLRTVVLQAVVAGDAAWIGPLPSEEGACWECGWCRLTDAAPALAASAPPAPHPLFSGPLCAIVAHTMAFEWFKHTTQAGQAETSGRMIRVALETAGTTTHPVQPHPRCRVHAPPEPDAEAVRLWWKTLAEAAPLEVEELSRRATGVIDPHVGVLGSVGEQSVPQLPLNAAVATVRGPAEPERPAVAAVATSFPAARQQATIAALEACATNAYADGRQRCGWNLRLGGPMVLNGDVGILVAAGLSWQEALARALLAHCHRLPAAPEAAGPAGPASGPASVLSPGTRRLLSLATMTSGGPVSVRSAHPLPSVITVTVQTGPVTARGTGPDADSAAHAAALLALARLQNADLDRPTAAIPAPGELPGSARPDDLVPILVRELHTAGFEVWAQPFHGDPAVSAVLPYLAAVALAGAA